MRLPPVRLAIASNRAAAARTSLRQAMVEAAAGATKGSGRGETQATSRLTLGSRAAGR
jgi:hypothetical protein